MKILGSISSAFFKLIDNLVMIIFAGKDSFDLGRKKPTYQKN
jgi:hypothetical protein